MESYLLSEPKVRGYRMRMLSLWSNKCVFWVSEQSLVDQANTICRNSWMTELEIEELEGNLAENESYREEEKVLMIQVVPQEKILKVDEDIGNLDGDEVTIIEEIA